MTVLQPIIYTVGSSNRTAEEFLSLLKVYEIETIADVRRFPTSKFEHFKKEKLQTLLEGADIGYIYPGKELGGFREGGYDAHASSVEFLHGIEKLEQTGRLKATAIMCAELLPWRCHRAAIGGVLSERGWKVVHIIDEKRVWTPEDKSASRA